MAVIAIDVQKIHFWNSRISSRMKKVLIHLYYAYIYACVYMHNKNFKNVEM